MKDYYRILGIAENASREDIRKAFRRLAFQYHPDTNPGREDPSAEKFKEINEAYGILGDEEKRRQYDAARKGAFAGRGYQPGYGPTYSQQDIFRDIFANPAMAAELNRMFAQAGLRFDRDFMERVYFGRGGVFRFYTSSGATTGAAETRPGARASAYQPNTIERWLGRTAAGIGKFVGSKLLGLVTGASASGSLDHHADLEISAAEAASGVEKEVAYRRGGQDGKLVVRVPPGVKTGTRIRLKGMGMTAGGRAGDLFLHVKIRKRGSA